MARPILEKSRPAISVRDFSRDTIAGMFRERLLAHPEVEAAFLFGSSVSGKVSFWSDCDLLIVARTEEPFIKRPLLFPELAELGFALDLLVYTPEEFAGMEADASPFWRSFRNHHLRVV